MLYKKNGSKELDPQLFQNPSSEYRGTPFWAWNCQLNKELLERQIGYLKEMGFGGFHMHSRVGLATPYLSEEFMQLIKDCVEKAREEKMLAWLYDEDRWPSGAAGGFVTREYRYREKYLLFTAQSEDSTDPDTALQQGGTYLVACYDIDFYGDGTLKSYKRVSPGVPVSGKLWYAYCKTSGNSGWFNNQSYVNTLDKASIEKFIEITYETYKDAVGKDFGDIIPSIFTDEPQFARKQTLKFASDTHPVTLPWTYDFADSFKETFGYDILDHLPEIIWDLPESEISRTRYLYHDHIAERFASAFADTCGSWCQKNGLMLTGHMMEEASLFSQTRSVGDTMRSYRSFQLPGIDILCNAVELTTAKQAQSAAHQYGREGVLSELYGVTNWDFDFRGHKFQGDWQAALGVTVRVPHLAWVSMAGEAKRDYPAAISYQSPWFREYPFIEDYFARLNTVLTRGEPIVNIAVIHPVESYWLHWGPEQNTNTIRNHLESNFNNTIDWLLSSHLDFDYVCESMLPSQFKGGKDGFNVGEMRYLAVIIPALETIRSTTLKALEEFSLSGGTIIFMGDCPKYVDAVPSDAPKALYSKSTVIPLSQPVLAEALADVREIEILRADGSLASELIYNMRRDGDLKWVFIAHKTTGSFRTNTEALNTKIILKGKYRPTVYNTVSGDIYPVPYHFEGDNTVLEYAFFESDSLLLKLEACDSEINILPCVPSKKLTKTIDIKHKVAYTREEPNVLLLDIAEFKLDDGPFNEEEEILRLHNICRGKLGWPLREETMAQPWVTPADPPEHSVTLRFTFQSEFTVTDPQLAIEDAESVKIIFNGTPVPSDVLGYYVDESIKTVALPPIRRGENILEITVPLGQRTNLEWCYILGNFNVKVEGCEKTIIAPTDKIGFSDISSQGMPFYGGNLTYHIPLETPVCDLKIRACDYMGALIAVFLDGKKAGRIVFSPYELIIPDVSAGQHELELKIFGNRNNTFGALHLNNNTTNWFSPSSWRTAGCQWHYEYTLKETGIKSSPIIEIYE